MADSGSADSGAAPMCPECAGDQIYRHDKPVNSAGSFGPDLLPGLSKNLLRSAKLTITVCADCGLIRFHASEGTRDRLSGSDSWQKD